MIFSYWHRWYAFSNMHFCKSFNPLLKCCDVLDMSKNHHIGLFYKLFIFCNVWTVCVHHVWSFAKFPYLKKVFEVVRFFISIGFTRAVLNDSKKMKVLTILFLPGKYVLAKNAYLHFYEGTIFYQLHFRNKIIYLHAWWNDSKFAIFL